MYILPPVGNATTDNQFTTSKPMQAAKERNMKMITDRIKSLNQPQYKEELDQMCALKCQNKQKTYLMLIEHAALYNNSAHSKWNW